MAGNKKMSSSAGDTDKEVMLRELQKSIHFVKTVLPSHVKNVNKPCILAIPSWFVKMHGDKFHKAVLLRSGLSAKPWRVQVKISHRATRASEVKFSSGWKEFSTFHGLVVGDDLLFSLRELSVFDVYIFRKSGNRVKPSSLRAPRTRSHDFEVSEDGVPKTGDYREGKVFAFNGRSTPGRIASPPFEMHYLESRNLRDPPTFFYDSHEGQQPPVEEEAEELLKPCTRDNSVKHFGDEDKDLENHASKTRKIMPPSFRKRLTASNFFSCRREPRFRVPKDFVRTYGSELHPPIVKLQGIHERCPVRIVVCEWKQDGENASRLYLTDGWKEFGDENGLKVGQELSFALTADSYLVVRVRSD